ncbi:hypothetical protein CL634_10265 [bacterium]|nr:hypothetical protein [bacterium]
MNKLEEFFENKPKRFQLHKLMHYFEIYDRHFSKYVDKQPSILEVGVDYGGSVEMWDDYFGEGCKIYGVDLSERSKEIEKYMPNVKITLGDQGSVDFWDEYKKQTPKFDIIIDDGGHRMEQQITTFECMYDHIKDDGVYLCEDLHTSYFPKYGGGFKKPSTFIEYSKNFIDYINVWWWDHNGSKETNPSDFEFRKKTNSIHFYDSVVVLEKRFCEEEPTGRRAKYPQRPLL